MFVYVALYILLDMHVYLRCSVKIIIYACLFTLLSLYYYMCMFQNALAPGKRPMSSIAPTVLIHKEHPCSHRVILGGVGGARITTGRLPCINQSFPLDKNQSIWTSEGRRRERGGEERERERVPQLIGKDDTVLSGLCISHTITCSKERNYSFVMLVM